MPNRRRPRWELCVQNAGERGVSPAARRRALAAVGDRVSDEQLQGSGCLVVGEGPLRAVAIPPPRSDTRARGPASCAYTDLDSAGWAWVPGASLHEAAWTVRYAGTDWVRDSLARDPNQQRPTDEDDNGDGPAEAWVPDTKPGAQQLVLETAASLPDGSADRPIMALRLHLPAKAPQAVSAKGLYDPVRGRVLGVVVAFASVSPAWVAFGVGDGRWEACELGDMDAVAVLRRVGPAAVEIWRPGGGERVALVVADAAASTVRVRQRTNPTPADVAAMASDAPLLRVWLRRAQ